MEPILADLRLAKGCVLVSDMVMYFRMWACSNRTRMCDDPESIIIVMLGLGSLSLCCCDGNVELAGAWDRIELYHRCVIVIFAALIVRLIRIRLVVRWSFVVSRFAIIVQECSVLARRNRYYCVFRRTNKFYCVFIGRIFAFLGCSLRGACRFL